MTRHHHHSEVESHSACQTTEERERHNKLATEAYGGFGSSDKVAETKDDTQKVQDKKAELESEYHVKFETASTSDYGDRVREPSLDELRGVEAALKKSRASVLQSDSSKSEMRLVFLKDQREGEPTAQNQQTSTGSRTAIFGNTGWPATEQDVTGDTKNSKNSVSLENQLLHEFGHQAESSTAIDPVKMGWKKAGDDWARETKDGRLWKFDFDKASNKVYEWYEVDADGKRKEGSTMSNVDMMEQSKVKPATDYFRTPSENFAEGVRLNRQGKETREQFEKDNPELAQYIDEYDKQEIASKMGLDDNHKPLYARDADGAIVANPESDGVPQGTLSKVWDVIKQESYILPVLLLV